MKMETVFNTKRKEKRYMGKKMQENVFAYLMLAPDLIGLAIFVFLPIIVAFYVSLHSWNALEPMKYIGFKNYNTLLHDTDWWKSLLTTAKYSLMFVPMVFCVSLLLSVFINSIPGKMQEYLRTVYFLPYSISTIVGGIIWMFMFDVQRGYFNAFLKFFHIPPQTYLANPKQALFCIALISAWMIVGYYTILFLAAIKDIPMSYYEAAKIDGANAITTFFKITLPLIKQTSTFVLVITTIASFQVFDQVKILTNGGPANATNVSVFYIYKQSFEFMKLGYASALAFVLFIIIFILSMFQLKLMQGDNES